LAGAIGVDPTKMAHFTPGKSAWVIVAVHPSLVSLMGPRVVPCVKQRIAPREFAEQATIVVYFTLSAKYRSSETTKLRKSDFIVSVRASVALLALISFITESPAVFPCFEVSVRPASSISFQPPAIAVAES